MEGAFADPLEGRRLRKFHPYFSKLTHTSITPLENP
jgi:hypothetical protein